MKRVPNLTGMVSSTVRIEPADASSQFRSGVHALDDYFARHAVKNDRDGISTAYVLRRSEADSPDWPPVLGYYTLSMAELASPLAAAVLGRKLPRYPLPVALIGRLAVDGRVQGHRVGEKLLLDALGRAFDAATRLGCLGVIVDAKDERAGRFYAKYDFVEFADEALWPRRMFLAMSTIREAFENAETPDARLGLTAS